MENPRIHVMPQPLSKFAIHVYGTEQQHRELRDQLLTVLTLADATRTRPDLTDELAKAVADVLVTLDMLYQEPFWTAVGRHTDDAVNTLAACMACHGYHDEEGEDD